MPNNRNQARIWFDNITRVSIIIGTAFIIFIGKTFYEIDRSLPLLIKDNLDFNTRIMDLEKETTNIHRPCTRPNDR